MSDVIYIEDTDIGATLTTWCYCAMWQMFAAEKLGARCYINWPRDPMRALRPCYDDAKFNEIPNQFDWYFEQPMISSPPPPADRVWTWQTPPPDLAKALGEHNLYGPVSQIKEFYRKHLKLNSVVNARGEALVKKYGIDFSKTIGVTWRGTDSIIDGRPRMPIETYFPFLDDILEKYTNCDDCRRTLHSYDICQTCKGTGRRDLRIMCTAEEEGILEPLLARYPSAFKIHEFFTTPQGCQQLGDNPERFSSLPGFERGMQPALMVYLFSKCAHYVKNRSSTGAVASWLSNGRIVCLAHPENLGHGWDVTKAEINGEVVPLNR